MATDVPNKLEHLQEAVFAKLDEELPSGQSTQPEPVKEAGPPPVTQAAEIAATPETDKAEPPSPQSEKPSLGPNYQDFIKKHGDPEKGAAHYWETQRQNKTLAEEKAALEAELAKLRETASPSEATQPEIHPQLAQYDDQLRAIEQNAVTFLRNVVPIKQQRDQAANLVGQHDRKIASLSRRIPTADIESESTLKRELAQAHSDRDEAYQAYSYWDAQYRAADQRAKELLSERNQTEKERAFAERMLGLERAREASEQERERLRYEAEVDADAASHKETFKTLATELKIPEKQHKRFQNYITGNLMVRLNAMEAAGDRNGIPDLQAAIREQALDFKSMFEEETKERIAGYQKAKEERTSTEGPTGKAAVVATPPIRKRSEQDVFESLEL